MTFWLVAATSRSAEFDIRIQWSHPSGTGTPSSGFDIKTQEIGERVWDMHATLQFEAGKDSRRTMRTQAGDCSKTLADRRRARAEAERC